MNRREPYSGIQTVASGGGASGVNWIIVANEAALAVVPGGLNGQPAFSLAARSEWIANTADPGPAQAGVKVVNAAGGYWVRTSYSDPQWRDRIDIAGVASWQIDALVGNDEASGAVGSPLKTHAEWARRLGLSTWQLKGSVTLTYTSIAAMPPVTDPFPLTEAPYIPDPSGAAAPYFLTIQGPAYVAKAGHSGVLTAVTARVRATNTPWNVTCSGTIDATDIGLRLRITGGARAGAMTYVDRILGANNPETSEWEITALDPVTFTDTHVTPSSAAADPVGIFTAGTIYANRIAVRGGCQGTLLFQDLDIDTDNAADGDPLQFFADGAGIMWNRCRFLAPTVGLNSNLVTGTAGAFWGFIYPLNCFANGSGGFRFRSGGVNENIINGGLYKDCTVFSETGAGFQWDADAKCSGGVVASTGGASAVGAGSVFRSPQFGFGIGSNAIMRVTTLFYGIVAMYGQGNTGAGLQIAQRGAVAYDAAQIATLTVVGATDFQLAGATLGFWFDAATGVFQPPAGLSTTWAHLQAAAGVAGFGGQAHSPQWQCGIFTAAGGLYP